jgi:hypothetical protein
MSAKSFGTLFTRSSFDMNSSARLQCYFSRSSNGATGVMTPCCKPKYRSSMSEDTPSFDLML